MKIDGNENVPKTMLMYYISKHEKNNSYLRPVSLSDHYKAGTGNPEYAAVRSGGRIVKNGPGREKTQRYINSGVRVVYLCPMKRGGRNI